MLAYIYLTDVINVITEACYVKLRYINLIETSTL